jgi:hypothetical protein
LGYHVSILRSNDPIPRGETERLVEQRPDVVLTRTSEDHFEFSTSGSSEDGPLLVWQAGEIWSKNPERSTLELMLDLAKALDARVRGDELETYSSPDETYAHPDDAGAQQDARVELERTQLETRRRQLKLNIAIFGTFALLALFAHLCSR